MKRALPFALLLAGCVGQPHPLSPSEKVECRFDLIADYVHTIPDSAIYEALTGSPEALGAYLLKSLPPADVVDIITAWRACGESPPE